MNIPLHRIATFALLGLGSLVHAGPVEIRETARIVNPDPSYTSFGDIVAVDGDYAIAVGHKNVPDPNPDANDDTLNTAFLFHYVNGAWTYVRPLMSDLDHNEGDGGNSMGIAMRDGIAALALQPIRVFERVGTDYVERTITGPGTASSSSPDLRGDDVQIDGNRILFGGLCFGGLVYDRQADGSWLFNNYLRGDNCGSTDGASGGPVTIGEVSVAVANPYNSDGLPAPALTIFQNFGSGWSLNERAVLAAGHDLGEIAMSGEKMLVDDTPLWGTALWRRGDWGSWGFDQYRYIRSAGDWMSWKDCRNCYPSLANVALLDGPNHYGDGTALRYVYDWDKGVYVWQVHTADINDFFKHDVTLVASDGKSLGKDISISGRRIIVGGGYHFELPESFTQTALIQHTFSGVTQPGWTTTAGSQFALTQGSDSRVYRQSSTVGEAVATLDAANWTEQTIQADITPTAINGADRWVGLVTRRSDASNYYYVTLRSSGTLMLKRMRQGVFTTLASTSVPFALNRKYRIRLESMHGAQRVYVDNVKVLQARDTTLTQGRPGLMTYRAAADFDNVLASPGSQTTVWADAGDGASPPNPAPYYFGIPYDQEAGEWTWENEGTNVIFRQSSLTEYGRAYAGRNSRNAGNLTVEARVRVRAFGAGSDPWVGLAFRAEEDYDNYTYLSFRRSNTVTLRTRYGNTLTQRGAAVQTVTPGVWYRLRMELVGNQLRAFVNGRLVIETTMDASEWGGKFGLLTYHAQADFDDIRVVTP
jgi:hypothetical protein